MRCFLAISLPQEVKDYLEDIILLLEKNNRRLRATWPSPENLHLTLGFIEEINNESLSKLESDLKSISLPADFMLSLNKLGGFPHTINPRVIKLSLTDRDGHLRPIRRLIQAAFTKNGIPTDNRPFSPHITMARIKDYGARVRLMVNIEPLSFMVSAIELIKSELTPSGPIYTILQSYK